ncbi:unnamed protein product [Soboliphyme baturini]|uniref:LRRCT domain-containing protein n=1 Tax=Soboliphyme baturini TaxID=241478 RepID=A0A183IYX4_9BILA|nr:unnamed protein product [Soboliphyme baturini]
MDMDCSFVKHCESFLNCSFALIQKLYVLRYKLAFDVTLPCLILAYVVVAGLCTRTLSESVHICSGNGPCRCKNGVANCDDEQLQTANLTVDKGTVISQLNIRNNMIQSLRKGAILPGQERYLQVLDFRQNFIKDVGNQAFMGMTSLRDLLLPQNKISVLRQGMFDNLDYSLVNLDLSNNLLRTFSGPVFSGLSVLHYLNLNDNPIASFDNETFEGLYELVELTVDNALLTTIDENAFLSLRKVQVLSFRNNHFETVPVFRGLSSLQKLDLSENPIHVVPSHAFKWVPNIQYLNLKFMPHLERVQDCAFCGLHGLKQLIMYGCARLTSIDTFAFGPSQYFKEDILVVDLSNNSLSTLDMHLLPWKNVSSIKLFDNPWTCDCNLRWMRDPDLKFQGKSLV